MTRIKMILFVASLMLLLANVPAATIHAGGRVTDGVNGTGTIDQGYALVQLTGDPLSTFSRTKPPQGKKIDFDSSTVKSYRAQLNGLRNDFKAWLRKNAPNAKVTGEYDLALNAVAVQLNGTTLATLASAPMVQAAQYERVYVPLIDSPIDPDLALINALAAWSQAGGAANAGAGVKVAIVDTGIDITHPCFNEAGYPSQQQLGDAAFTNNKVIAAKVFNNKAGSRGYTAEAIQDHGTHVAGTVACNFNTPASVNGVSIPYGVSGVAPAALLGNYNVFPGQVGNARSEDILNALEAAYADGFDVANMSLGGGASGIQDLLTIAVNNLDQANMVVAVAAGNSGPGHYTVESPGSAARALTAGASTVPHFIASPVTVDGQTYGAATGEFAEVTADLTAPLSVVTGSTNGLNTACSALSENLSGKIALITRGSCTFSTKIRNTQNAGAIAVLVVNNVLGTPIAMAEDGTPNQPTVPAYMVSKTDGAVLKTKDGVTATIGSTPQYINAGAPLANIMAGFSSQGPTDVDFRVKPDVVAPGVNVLSAIPASACAAPPCWAFFQGTSMATPHLAGSAAVVRGMHPTWSAAQVRSAIVNTADRTALKSSSTGNPVTDPNVIGAGLENLLAAVNAQVALDPVSISFGAVPSGAGQKLNLPLSITNISGSTLSLLVSVGTGDSSVAYTVSPTTVTLSPGESATVTVSMSAVKGAATGDHQVWLIVQNGATEIAHAAVYTFVK